VLEVLLVAAGLVLLVVVQALTLLVMVAMEQQAL
jgi:hypothetical protein